MADNTKVKQETAAPTPKETPAQTPKETPMPKPDVIPQANVIDAVRTPDSAIQFRTPEGLNGIMQSPTEKQFLRPASVEYNPDTNRVTVTTILTPEQAQRMISENSNGGLDIKGQFYSTMRQGNNFVKPLPEESAVMQLPDGRMAIQNVMEVTQRTPWLKEVGLDATFADKRQTGVTPAPTEGTGGNTQTPGTVDTTATLGIRYKTEGQNLTGKITVGRDVTQGANTTKIGVSADAQITFDTKPDGSTVAKLPVSNYGLLWDSQKPKVKTELAQPNGQKVNGQNKLNPATNNGKPVLTQPKPQQIKM